MGDSGPIPGWESSAADATNDPGRRSIADRLAEGARLYRARGRTLLGMALLVQGIVGLPLLAVSVGSAVQALRMFSGDLPFPQPGTAGIEWTSGPFHDVILDYTVMGLALGLSILGYLLTYGATSLLILGASGENVGAVALLRTTFARSRHIVLAGLALTVAFGVAFWVQGLVLARESIYASPSTYDGTGIAAVIILTLIILVAEFLALYAMVRWIVAIPVIVLEGQPLGAALGRSSNLTRGRRLSVAGLLTVAGFVVGLLLAVVDFVPALIVGSQLGWTAPAVIAIFAILALGGQIVAAPFITTVLTVLFRDLRAAGPRPRVASVEVPPGWGSNR